MAERVHVHGHLLLEGHLDCNCPTCGTPHPPVFYGQFREDGGAVAGEGAIARCSVCHRRAGILCATQDKAHEEVKKMFLTSPIDAGQIPKE